MDDVKMHFLLRNRCRIFCDLIRNIANHEYLLKNKIMVTTYFMKYNMYTITNEIFPSSRFGEALRIAQEHLDSKNFYIMNPEFDTGIAKDSNCGCGCEN